MKKNIYHDISIQIAQDSDNKIHTEKGQYPIFMASEKAKILIIGQAPGAITQEKGQVFLDKSGERLREWLGVTSETFYTSGYFAVLPMDFYFPGHGKSGDLPPRKNFAPKWHPMILRTMPDIELIILIGMYAQKYYLKDEYKTVTENVLHYDQFYPTYFPLIHPSPRNQIWISKHPEFIEKIIPRLKKIIRSLICD